MNKKCFPRLTFLGETTSHSTDKTTSHSTRSANNTDQVAGYRLQTTAAKSLVIPLAQGESVARGIWIGVAKR